jgi:peptidoglycan hydrolase FlgJ
MKVNSLRGLQIEPDSDFQKQKLKKACEDFEAIMVTYLFKSMRETSMRSEPEGEGEEFASGKGLYESMMDEAVAGELSHSQGLGLAKLLYKQLAPGLKT